MIIPEAKAGGIDMGESKECIDSSCIGECAKQDDIKENYLCSPFCAYSIDMRS
jgi:hypothetical protein